ncbi:interleukin-17 receptor A-like [Clupea harengus]|uniref:Interleukin-17 receptor A-like n=1 Tax=Clupea harengus TaxID=7950 RepID=A0A8M1KHM7_CLUHA|nr:interleukin-17 receptor A-like [Clupea harengus]
MRCLHLHWISTWNLLTVVLSLSSPDISITSDVLESGGPHETVSAILVSRSSQINVTCGPEEPVDAYESHESNPSVLHDLKLEVTSTDEGPALKVSWAVRVDASTSSLTGLWLGVSQRDPLWCQYSPPFNSFSIMDVDLLWFSYTVHVEPDSYYHIIAHNLPEPPFGSNIKIRKWKGIYTPACDVAIMKSHPTCVNRGKRTFDLHKLTVESDNFIYSNK